MAVENALCPSCGLVLHDDQIRGIFPGGEIRCACGGIVRAKRERSLTNDPYRSSEHARVQTISNEPMITCPFCGATCSALARECPRCDVKLFAARCSRCFTLELTGRRHCTHCGNELTLTPLADATDAPCPRCDVPLSIVPGEQSGFHACSECGGVFVSHERLEVILRDGYAPAHAIAARSHPRVEVQYLKCPLCHDSMNRTNFRGNSGIVIDICMIHGTWFDIGELARTIAHEIASRPA